MFVGVKAEYCRYYTYTMFEVCALWIVKLIQGEMSALPDKVRYHLTMRCQDGSRVPQLTCLWIYVNYSHIREVSGASGLVNLTTGCLQGFTSQETMEADWAKWVARNKALKNADEEIDFQTDYVLDIAKLDFYILN